MCAGGLGTDTCQVRIVLFYSFFLKECFKGDSGGALQCRIPVGHESYRRCNGWFVRGITSFGKGCNLLGQPGVYVDLSNKGVLNWIQDWIKVLRHKSLDAKRLRVPRKILDNMANYIA